jgi:hypothetical protein
MFACVCVHVRVRVRVFPFHTKIKLEFLKWKNLILSYMAFLSFRAQAHTCCKCLHVYTCRQHLWVPRR